MADWTQAPPHEPPPGATQPAPLPTSPGWAPWVNGVAAGAGGGGGGANPATTSVQIQVTRGETVKFATEGDNPGPWEIQPVTSKLDDPYRDFTRFRRKYPKITWREYTKVRVKVVIQFANGTTFEDDFTFWEPGPAVPLQNWWVYTWKHTSGKREIEDGVIEDWYDGLPPDREGPKPWFPEDTYLPERSPPKYLRNVAMLDVPDIGGEYALLGPRWRDASAETLFAAAGRPWVKLSALKGAASKGAKRARSRG
jgi:hypothetical protein